MKRVSPSICSKLFFINKEFVQSKGYRLYPTVRVFFFFSLSPSLRAGCNCCLAFITSYGKSSDNQMFEPCKLKRCCHTISLTFLFSHPVNSLKFDFFIIRNIHLGQNFINLLLRILPSFTFGFGNTVKNQIFSAWLVLYADNLRVSYLSRFIIKATHCPVTGLGPGTIKCT